MGFYLRMSHTFDACKRYNIFPSQELQRCSLSSPNSSLIIRKTSLIAWIFLKVLSFSPDWIQLYWKLHLYFSPKKLEGMPFYSASGWLNLYQIHVSTVCNRCLAYRLKINLTSKFVLWASKDNALISKLSSSCVRTSVCLYLCFANRAMNSLPVIG